MNKITDEEILSYLMQDCSAALKAEIEANKLHDTNLIKRIDELSLLGRQIKIAPINFEVFRKKKRLAWFQTLAMATVTFVVGIYLGARLSFPQNQTINIQHEAQLSTPIEWSEPQTKSLI